MRGSHATVALYNQRWFGIELEGDYRQTFDVMTSQQWLALIELSAWLSKWGAFDNQQIKSHKEVKGNINGGTDCPGKVIDHLGELRQAVHERKLQI